MANIDRPHGFTVVGSLTGAPINEMNHLYNIAAAYGTAIYIGDVVTLAGDADTRGVPTIAKSGTTSLPVGVVTGFIPKPGSGLEQKYSPASEIGYAMVCDDPSAIFSAQIDGTFTAGDTGVNTLITTVAGNATTGISGEELDYSEAGTTNTLMFKILRLYDVEDNEIGANSEVLCKFNVHQHSVSTGATAT